MHFESVEQAREQALQAMQSKEGENAMNILTASVKQYPHDGMLLYFYAAELAEQQQFDDALEQFSNAVFNAPNLHIARFQLALLASTLERFDLVEQHLPYLMELKDSHYLGQFANGLAAVFADDLANAANFLEQGIATNQENPALNTDMQQMLERIRHSETQSTPSQSQEPEEEEIPSSISGSVLLDIYKNTH